MATYPATPAPARVTIGSISPNIVSVTHSGRRRVRSRGGQRWKFRLSYNAMTRAQLAPLWDFLTELRGRYGTCQYTPPFLGTPLGSISGSPKTEGPQNLVDYSEDYNNASWDKSGGVIQGSLVADPPDLAPIDSMVSPAQCWGSTTAAWNWMRNNTSATMVDDNVFSVYMKYGGADRSGINLYNTTDSNSVVYSFYWNSSGQIYGDQVTGTGTGTGGNEYIGDGWYRVYVYRDGSLENGDGILLYIYPAINETGTRTFVHSAQFAQGVTTPVGYIPTEASELAAYQDQHGQALYTKGWTASTSNVVRAGDFVKLPSDDKVYMVCRDVDSNIGGYAVLWLSSPLIKSPALDSVPDFTDQIFTVALETDIATMSIDTALYNGLEVNLIEVNT